MVFLYLQRAINVQKIHARMEERVLVISTRINATVYQTSSEQTASEVSHNLKRYQANMKIMRI